MPTMPIEFSVAAFRLGHSMVRADYSWNKVFPDATLGQLFEFSHLSGGLGGGADSRASGSRTSAGSTTSAIWRGARRSWSSRRASSTRRCGSTRSSSTRLRDAAGVPTRRRENNLAFRNLLRANMVKLATGQQMVTFLKSKGVALTKLTKAQIRDGNGGADARRAHARAADRRAADEHAALVLHPARGGAQPGQAQWRRRADRGGDVPSRDRGQQVLDRPRHRLPADAWARTTPPSAWSTSCSSRSTARPALLNPNGN